MKHVLAISAVAMFTAGTAVAGGLEGFIVEPAPEVVASAPSTWTGAYVGGTAGWMFGGTYDVNLTPVTSTSFDGMIVGGFAGYTYQFDSGLVLGGELAVSTGVLDYPASPSVRGTFVDAKGRVGYAFGDLLVFASGGYSMGFYGNGDQGSGWNVGGGAEYMVTDQFFIGGEYIYRNITDTQNTPAIWEDRFGTVQARIGYRF